jgi:hypothetical protein
MTAMKTGSLVQRRGWLLLAAMGVGCGGSSASSPTPEPTPVAQSWYVSPVLCGNCPGLTNVDFDRTVMPHRARLPTGARTSVRAVAPVGCGTDEVMLHIVRWIVADPSVISVEPSSTESAIVTALKPGISSLHAERRLPTGALGLGELQDAFGSPESPRCTALPALVFEVTG